MCDVHWHLSGRVSALHSMVAGSISSGEDHGIHCWWDLIRSKQLSSVSVCRTQVFARFSDHGNSFASIYIFFYLSITAHFSFFIIYIYIYIYILICLVEYRELLLFKNLQVKTFKSSYFSSYFWIKLIKKEPYISPRAFDHFTGHLPGRVRLLQWVLYLFGMVLLV